MIATAVRTRRQRDYSPPWKTAGPWTRDEAEAYLTQLELRREAKVKQGDWMDVALLDSRIKRMEIIINEGR